MKKVSLKIKLTLLYTIFILVVVGTVLGILFSLSGREILASTKKGKWISLLSGRRYPSAYVYCIQTEDEPESGRN
mgnify:CR=1 FL=1